MSFQLSYSTKLQLLTRLRFVIHSVCVQSKRGQGIVGETLFVTISQTEILRENVFTEARKIFFTLITIRSTGTVVS